MAFQYTMNTPTQNQDLIENVIYSAPVNLTNLKDIDLNNLKDLVMPTPPSVFPLAFGWWILIIILLILVCFICFFICKYYFSSKTYALLELKDIKNQNLPDFIFLREISKLLRRVSLFLYPKQGVGKLSEQSWSDFLHQKAPHILPQHVSDLIAFSTLKPDQTKITVTKKDLYVMVRKWIIKVFKDQKNECKHK